nr:YidB family protein [Undibacterium curvum]
MHTLSNFSQTQVGKMGLFDTALSMLGNANSAEGGGQSALIQAALGLLNQGGQGETGGLQGLLSQFQQAGLGDVVASWVGTGQNLPISAEQIQQVLGNGQLAQLAESAGIPHDGIAGQLASMLPGLIDHLTPNGEVPEAGKFDASSVLQGLSSLFSK